jgi:DNA-binding NtrC family response regulator
MNLVNVPRIKDNEIDRLKAYEWPGNVRELQNIVERALLVSKGEFLLFPPLTGAHRKEETHLQPCQPTGDLSLDAMMNQHIRSVLNQVGGKIDGQGGAAEVLQMNPSTLRFRMKKLGIQRKQLY